MTKKKERRDDNKNYIYHYELMGLLLILITIIGLGDFGPVGNIISGFAIFIAGTWYWVVLLYIFWVGIYMIIYRENPNFISQRLIGLYFLFTAFLILSHINYIQLHETNSEVLKETVNRLLLAFNDPSRNVDSGGGIIGALLGIIFVTLFANGALIIVFSLIVFSIIMLTNISIGQIFNWFKSKIKKISKREKYLLNITKKADKDYDKDNKVVISNIEELTQIEHEENNFETNKEEYNEETTYNEYIFPPMTFLNNPKKDLNSNNESVVKKNIEILQRVLKDFDVNGKIVQVHVGPTVTQYELELKAGTKVNRVLSINREIALALAAKTVRIQAPIPGKNTIGIEIPNFINTTVCLRKVLSIIPKDYNHSKLLVGLGIDIMGKPIFTEINKTPHLLIAGATGSGKSVCINSIIVSILMRAKPDEVKLLLIDPKKVELNLYDNIPHLLSSVITEPRKASVALKKVVNHMEHRYNLFSEIGAKGIAGYNKYVENKNKHLAANEKMEKLPYIVVIIDELADLMLIASKEVEDSIMRITQMARTAGIHLIVATQRPSIDVITGIIKANIPSRISFAVSSNIDSRTILDMSGAEKLLGKGDMLFLPMGESIPIRLQGSFISEIELKRIVNWTINQQKVKYDKEFTILEEPNSGKDRKDEYDDPLYNEILEFTILNGKISTSLIQRKYRLGYNRAARIIDLLEERGIIGPANGSKPREVLVELEKKEDS